MLKFSFTDSIKNQSDLPSLERLSLFMSDMAALKLKIPNFFGFDPGCVVTMTNNLKMIMAEFKQIIDRADISQKAKNSFALLSDEYKSSIFNICLHLANNLEFKQLDILCRLSMRQIDQLYEHDLVNILNDPIDPSIRLKNFINALLPAIRPSSADSSLGRNNSGKARSSSCCRPKTP